MNNNYVGFYFKFNKNTDKDIIMFLDTLSNKQGFIKYLIRSYLKHCKMNE